MPGTQQDDTRRPQVEPKTTRNEKRSWTGVNDSCDDRYDRLYEANVDWPMWTETQELYELRSERHSRG